MIHTMGLYEQPFQSIKAGKKTVEVRLNDEKRRLIKRGDIIRFREVPHHAEELKVEVLTLRNYDTFKEMYESIPAEDFAAEERSVDEMVQNTYKIYTPEQEKKWGTLAITIKLLEGTP
ncbi:ASCH domain-containing protein [Virgibacillus sp. C22-A2]|uniref:ASCH domain-containing protein n=1 Tax=Virgibacillus tibetensis TaxID=3042313 RepID=A0ABU6KK81_9BACI|nr:ASCH domain-containing protein [Virgibacillus sp. C22-A2]